MLFMFKCYGAYEAVLFYNKGPQRRCAKGYIPLQL